MRKSLGEPGLLLAAAIAAITGAGAAKAEQSISGHDLALLNRLTWGETASAAVDFQAKGAKTWLEDQLRAPSRGKMPIAAQAQIAALPIANSSMAELVVRLDAQNKAAAKLPDVDQRKAAQQAYQQAMSDVARQAAARSLLRDLYSPDQLQEQMTWFWLNHFNVHMYKRDIRAMIGDYEDQAIRPRALGKFRSLLEATLKHPAMLRYLDNDQNAAGHINENYAREIMELHTMGVGSGYTQKDVQELARILTGVGVDLSPDAPKLKAEYQPLLVKNGLFEFNPNRHDFGDKIFLGHSIRGSGFDEVEQALDILAREPATARHVSTQMAAYFMGDDPPAALVDRMARTFQHTDGDIAATLRTLFSSREFDATLGKAFKDPVHYTVSAVRFAYDDKVILNTQPMQSWLNRMSEGLFNHETPDGFATAAAAWSGPGQMAVRFEIARQIGSASAGLFRPDQPAAKEAPAFPQLQNALYFKAGLDQTLAPATKNALGQAGSPQDWNTLFLSSPEFMRR